MDLSFRKSHSKEKTYYETLNMRWELQNLFCPTECKIVPLPIPRLHELDSMFFFRTYEIILIDLSHIAN